MADGTRSNRFTGLVVGMHLQFIILFIRTDCFFCFDRSRDDYADLVTMTGPLPTLLEPLF